MTVTLSEDALQFPLSSAQAVGHPNHLKSQLQSLSAMGHLGLAGAEAGRCVVHSDGKGGHLGSALLAVSSPQPLGTARLLAGGMG